MTAENDNIISGNSSFKNISNLNTSKMVFSDFNKESSTLKSQNTKTLKTSALINHHLIQTLLNKLSLKEKELEASKNQAQKP